MYPPPQDYIDVEGVSSRSASPEHGLPFGLDFIRSQMKHNSPPPPFSYGYVLEDGKMPQLAEFHAVQKKSTAGVLRSSSTRSDLQTQRRPVPVIRSSSYNITAKPTAAVDSNTHESTSDKIKRAFSLSSGRNSSQPSRQPSRASQREQTQGSTKQPNRHASQPSRRPKANLTIESHHARQSATPSASRVPSLILPTPTPSPEPVHSAASSPQNPPMSFALPPHHAATAARPFSWAFNDDVIGVEDAEDYDDDIDDIAFLQASGMGRLVSNHHPPRQFRKEKAFELLGITNKTKKSPHTPALSAAGSFRASPSASDRDQMSRASSRKVSQEDYRRIDSSQSRAAERVGGQSRRISTPTRSPNVTTADENTPRPNRQLRYQEPSSPASGPSTPHSAQRPVPYSKPTPGVALKTNRPPADQTGSAPSILISKHEARAPACGVHAPVLAEPQPVPVSVAKVSRFIEHLDANAKRLSLPMTPVSKPAPRPQILQQRTMSDPDTIAPAPRRATSPVPFALLESPGAEVPQLVVTHATRASADVGSSQMSFNGQLDASGVRRSASMREATTGPWGAVLCTAQARPILAAGHAKVV